MTSRVTTAIQVRRNRVGNDSGFTLTELLVAMLLTSVLLAVIIAPLISVTDAANSTQTASQAAETTTLAIESMQAGIASATQICLPTQITPSPGGQVVQPGYAVRVLTDVFDPSGLNPEWEQWWVDPTSGQLRAQTWLSAATPPSTWRVVSGNVGASTGGQLPFAITSEGIATTGPLMAGNYTATGTTADGTLGEVGTWTYTLHVYAPTAGTVAQTEPTSGTVTTTGSAAFSSRLTATGNAATVTYTQTTGTTNLTVSKSGKVTTTGAQTAGIYTATGTDTDGKGNTGTWTYTLNVYTPTAGTITQTTPMSGTVATTGSSGFSDQLAVTGNSTAVTFVQTTGSANLAIAAPPSTTRPKVLSIALTASTGVKSTAVSTPLTASLAALNTAYFTAPGTCLTEVH